MKLEGRRILITGAASGIGLETAKLFEAEGARLALLDRRHQAAGGLRQALADPNAHIFVDCDVTDGERMSSAMKQVVHSIGGLDGVVNSAGLDHVAAFEATSLTDWQRVVTGNLTATFIACHTALPHLKFSGAGTIVNLASGAALRPLQGRTAYCAAKAGVVMFSKTLALELAPDHIRVNAVCPGAIDTPMLRESAGGDVGGPLPEEVVARFAMGRVGEPREIAAAILFLSSSDSSFVTGAALAVDGGRTFH